MAIEPATQCGVVYLVGAGPGDPGLITLRGSQILSRATVVVYDALVNPRLLRLAPVAAERVPVGKRHGQRCMSQASINELLVARARAGATVVRLKGGDPFVFGRGGEEATALRAAGIRFEIVPGVTAGVAAAACAGIPVTHRDFASAVALVTGHEDPCKPDSKLDWTGLARFPGTLVFYMGVSRIASLAESLIAHGRESRTPVAVIERGTTAAQKSVTAPLGEIAARVGEAGVQPPAVVVVGPVASLGETLRWFENRPLFGQRIVVTRPEHQAAEMTARLEELGAEVLELPALRIEPPADWSDVDRAIDELHQFSWLVFTSANGVRFFLNRLVESGRDLRRLGPVHIAAIGAATARELKQFHLKADLVPESANSESLVAAIGQSADSTSVASSNRLLLLRADRAREALPDGLRAAGMLIDELAVYRHIDAVDLDAMVVDRIARGDVDWITVTSPQTVRSLMSHLPDEARAQLRDRIKLASISPLTSAAARELGLLVAAEAAVVGTDSLSDAIISTVRRQRRE